MKKSIVGMLSGVFGIVAGVAGMKMVMQKKINDGWKMSDKHLALFLMMNQWVKVKQEGKHLGSYFEENGYHEIAIYGMSYVGETLVDELAESNVEIKYGIDQNVDKIYAAVDLVLPGDKLASVDAIVITSIKSFDEIKKMLSKRISCPILSLEDILYEI